MTDYLETWLDSESAGQSVIAVKTIYIDINDGSLTDGFLFSQIVYWSGKNKEGRYRAQTMFGGHRWIVKEADEWFAECRIKDSTARESLGRIQARGLIVKEVHRFHGKACTHLRINPKVFEARIKLALEGKPMPKLDKKGKATSEVSGLPKSSKATLPKSSNPYTDTTVSEITPDRVSSYEDTLAQPSQAQVDAGAVLNPAEREILRACNDGVVIAHYHNAEATNHLIALGMIERCQCGAKDVLCLKGKCPTHDKPCPDDVKVNELQTALQQSFLPGSNGNQPETVVTPPTQTLPPAHPTPAALPEVPEGYEVSYRHQYYNEEGHDREYRHYRQKNRKRMLCGARHTHDKPINDLKFVYQCPDCAAKAAARAQGKVPREHDVLFKRVAEKVLGYPPENGHKYTRNQCSQINAIKAVVMQTLDLPEKKTPDDYQRGAEAIDRYQVWFPKAHPDLTAPTHDAKFATYFNEFWKSQPASKPQGDFTEPVWFERRFWKREAGVLYCKPQVGEWAQALPSEVEKWQTR